MEVPRDGESFHLPCVYGFAKTLSVDDFLMMLRRFVSIYRKPDHMFSDNGTNFVGAQRLLREELDKLKGDRVLVIEFKDLGIEWFFQPA